MHTAFLKSSFLARIFILVFLMLLPFAKGSAQTQPNAHELLEKMTLEEKIAQLSQLPGFPIPEFREQVGAPEDVIRKSGAGSVLWVSDPKEINRLQHIAVDESRLHIPILFGLDVIHGYHTIFPSPIAMASSWDPKLVESAQTVAAREARAAGIAWTFAPMLDIARDARWGRMVEGAGEDPYLGAAIARAQVLGFQGTKAGDPDRVLACAKHFAGYGAADGGRDYDSSYIPEEQMWNTYLPPFKAAADAHVGSFMSAYMDLNDVPATGNRWLLHDVLRDAWHYNGFVVSDANAVHSLITHGFARDGQDATLKAFSAGLDMDMASGTFLKYLGEEVKQGRISMQQVDNSVLPILEAKIRLGLFEHPFVDEARIPLVLNASEHLELARTAVQRSVVLLRNEQNLLPLDKGQIRSIAVIGPLADADLDLLDMWGAMTKPGTYGHHSAGDKEQGRQPGACRVPSRPEHPPRHPFLLRKSANHNHQRTAQAKSRRGASRTRRSSCRGEAKRHLGSGPRRDCPHERRGSIPFIPETVWWTRGIAGSCGRCGQARGVGVGQRASAGHLLGRRTRARDSGNLVFGHPGWKRNRRHPVW